MKNLININTKRVLFLCILVVCYRFSFAQTSGQGIYLSASDFNNHRVSFLQVPEKKYKIHLNETFYKPVVKILIGDSTFILNKDTVFGYRDKEGATHRFYKKIDYTILNPTETILLYSRKLLGGYHNSQTIIEYYFSANVNTAVLPLTKWDIKNAFPDDAAFHELLDMYFHRDAELLSYDHFYKIYKLNRALQISKQTALEQIIKQ